MIKYSLAVLVFLTAGLAGCAVPMHDFDEADWRRRAEATDTEMLFAKHVSEEGVFFNPWLKDERNFGAASWIRYNFSGRVKLPDFKEELYAHKENGYTYLKDAQNSSISYFGHATFIIKMNGQTILTDPFFSGKALIVSKKVKIDFDFNKLNDRPVVLISHNHYDHLDEYSVKRLIKKQAIFIVPLKLKDFFLELGANEVYELDWWQTVTLDGITYTFLPAQHWSRRIGQATNTTLWGGFLIQGEKNIYFSGDTGYFRGFELFGKTYQLDYALLSAGAYLPRWMMHYIHLDIPEFFLAVDHLKAQVAIPMHFGVIELGKEPCLFPLYEIDQYLQAHPEYREKVLALRVGEWADMKK